MCESSVWVVIEAMGEHEITWRENRAEGASVGGGESGLAP